MWKKIVTIMATLMLVAGLGLFMFPIVSNFVGTQIANAETEKFETQIETVIDNGTTFEEALEKKQIDTEGYPIDESGKRTSKTPIVFKPDLDRLRADSLAYNEDLKKNQGSLLVDEYSYIEPSLNLYEYGITDGIYGYVSAPSIDMKLPIYLGANNANMSYGAAHMTYTSLPLGGERTNTVLAGHTGYVGRVFFDNLRNLQIGDEVILRNYWENLSYKVVETKICKPDESGDCFIRSDADMLTMITCIKGDGKDFDRYYVLCKREQGAPAVKSSR